MLRICCSLLPRLASWLSNMINKPWVDWDEVLSSEQGVNFHFGTSKLKLYPFIDAPEDVTEAMKHTYHPAYESLGAGGWGNGANPGNIVPHLGVTYSAHIREDLEVNKTGRSRRRRDQTFVCCLTKMIIMKMNTSSIGRSIRSSVLRMEMKVCEPVAGCGC